MQNEIVKKIEKFISSNKSKEDYLSEHWKKIISQSVGNKKSINIIDELESSYYLDHYSLFKYTDNFIKHSSPRDKILIRKTLLSNLISNPISLIKVLRKIYQKSKSRDSIFLTQSLTLQSEVFAMSRQETIDAIKECESSGLRAIPIWGKRKINGVPSSIMVDVTCGPLWGSRR